jgi:hypothetical protein
VKIHVEVSGVFIVQFYNIMAPQCTLPQLAENILWSYFELNNSDKKNMANVQIMEGGARNVIMHHHWSTRYPLRYHWWKKSGKRTVFISFTEPFIAKDANFSIPAMYMQLCCESMSNIPNQHLLLFFILHFPCCIDKFPWMYNEICAILPPKMVIVICKTGYINGIIGWYDMLTW